MSHDVFNTGIGSGFADVKIPDPLKPKQSLLDKILGNLGSPGTQFALNLLQQGGPSPFPTSFGQAIGNAGIQTFQGQQQQTLADTLNRFRESQIQRNLTPGAGPDKPSAVREFEFYQGLSDKDKKEFIKVKRTTGQIVDIGGVPNLVDKESGGSIPLETPSGTATLESEIGAAEQEAGRVQAAKEQATTEAQIERRQDQSQFELPKVLAGVDAQIRQVNDTIDTVKSVIDQVSGLTTGFAGSLTSGIAGTPSFDLKAKIKTIQAQLGFTQLQQMREASKTGGALGQVSERELDLLISAKNNLDPRQSKEQLLENLNLIVTHFDNYVREINIMKEKLREQAGDQFAGFSIVR